MASVTGSYLSNSIFANDNNVGGNLLVSIFSGSNSSATIYLPVGTTGLAKQTTTYIKRGWYPTTRAFEYWQTLSPDGGPPSGHSLVDITILDTYQTN